MSLEGIADSVTVMRFRHQVRKVLGKVISLAALNENTNIKAQAQVLDSRKERLQAGFRIERAVNQPRVSAMPYTLVVIHLNSPIFGR